ALAPMRPSRILSAISLPPLRLLSWQAAELVRYAAYVLDEVGRHLADPVAAQGQRVDQAAEAGFDRADDLFVAADRGEEMRDVVGDLPGHLAPFALADEGVELEAEIFQAMHREDRVIRGGRAVKRDALAHPLEAPGDAFVIRAGGEKPAARDLVLGARPAGLGEPGLDPRHDLVGQVFPGAEAVQLDPV